MRSLLPGFKDLYLSDLPKLSGHHSHCFYDLTCRTASRTFVRCVIDFKHMSGCSIEGRYSPVLRTYNMSDPTLFSWTEPTRCHHMPLTVCSSPFYYWVLTAHNNPTTTHLDSLLHELLDKNGTFCKWEVFIFYLN
jgi:hypothetical protein